MAIGDLNCSHAEDYVLDRIARPFAEQFLVSPMAMRIRLEKLGLLHRQVPRQSVLSNAQAFFKEKMKCHLDTQINV